MEDERNLQPTPTILSGLGRRMLENRMLSNDDIHALHRSSAKEGHSFYHHVWIKKAIPHAQLIELASLEFGLPIVDMDSLNLEAIPLALIPFSLIEKHRALPIYQQGHILYLAVGDPQNNQGIDNIRFTTGFAIHAILCDREKLSRLIAQISSNRADKRPDLLRRPEPPKPTDWFNLSQSTNKPSDTSVVSFVDEMLNKAISSCASDVHIEPYESHARIRYRIDGLLYEIANIPLATSNRIAARLKILADLNIAEKRLPQDGRMKLPLSTLHIVDCRVSTLPMLFGEKVVVRILDGTKYNMTLETIGMNSVQLQHYRHAANQPYGMILVTGPTGSGKTISLYAALAELNTPERNISSVEDPVEIFVEGINQVNVNTKSGLTFANTLRALLRQDPDVIMVGEVRDSETAEISIKAAQTGHLVLSTLHTNDAPGALVRLLNMGIAPFNLSSSINLVVAQRLIRRLCLACRKPVEYPNKVLINAGFDPSEIPSFQLYRPQGCDGCTDGFRGRTGIFEVMPISSKISELIMSKGDVDSIIRQARLEEVETMKQAGLAKVAEGITALEEIERVTLDS